MRCSTACSFHKPIYHTRHDLVMDRVRAANTAAFAVSSVVTGVAVGAFVWALLFVIDLGISSIWDRVPVYLGEFYPLIMCTVGGAVIGFFVKRCGPYPESLQTVLGKVKADGRYGYDKIGRMSVGAALPLIFGGSVGPEAGLTGAVAALSTWAGDRLRRFGRGFGQLSRVGTYAALSAIFTAPLYGLAGAVDGDGECDPYASKWVRWAIYAAAVGGAFGAFLLLTRMFGGGLSLPRYTDISFGKEELIWAVPLILVGAVAGWLFRIFDAVFSRISELAGDRPVSKAVTAGVILGLCGMALPFVMFSGEVQADELNATWAALSAAVLVATGFVKIAATALCVNMGWRGGHFFPTVFAGISIGYGMASVLGIDPVFCVCAVTAAVVGGVVRRPLMAVLLLFLCFPLHSVVLLAAAAFVGSKVPLPGSVKGAGQETSE